MLKRLRHCIQYLEFTKKPKACWNFRVHNIMLTDVTTFCGKIYISTFNLLIQDQEKEERRDLKADDVDPTEAGKAALLDLRSLSFILILPALSTCRLTDTKSMMGEEKEEEERGQWSNPCDFFISCLGYAVGLGLLQS